MNVQSTMMEETTPAPVIESLGKALFELHERFRRTFVKQRVNKEGLARTPVLEAFAVSPEEHSGLAGFAAGEVARRINGVAITVDPSLKKGEFCVELIHQRGSVKFERRETVRVTAKDLVEPRSE
jgi:hypothetical protein